MSDDRDTELLNSIEIESLQGDAKKHAEALNLVYVTDTAPGISRIKKGENFTFIFNNRVIKDEKLLERIRKLVIPPAWEKVWICPKKNGHLQCTGFDSKGRKQYRYHHLWSKMRNMTKFYRLKEFGEALPQLRIQLEKDIAQKNLTEEKVLATAISLIECTYMRVGNSEYEKLYGSYGLTTMKDKHVKINGDKLSFSFNGKKGVRNNISLKNKRLSQIVKQCKEIPGKELFQYKDEEGNYKSIDSGKINIYLKKIMGKDFTAKDFRTWAGSLNTLQILMNIKNAETIQEIKKNIVETLNEVSSRLGNTRAVCKKHYVHPVIFELYENKNLNKIIDEFKISPKINLTREENILLKILGDSQQ